MRASWTIVSWLIIGSLIPGVLGSVLLPSTGLTQEQATDVLRVSPTYGYVLYWNPHDDWTIVEESLGDSVESMILVSGAETIVLEAYEAYGGDPETCLSRAETALAESARIQQFEPAEYESGEPVERFEDGLASRAYMTVDNEVASASGFTAWEMTCMTLVQGEAVLRVWYTAPAEDYRSRSGTPVLRSIHLPRAAFGELEGPTSVGCAFSWVPAPPPAVMVDANGNEIGTISILSFGASLLDSGWPMLIAFENTGASTLTIDPLAFYIESPQDGAQFYPVDATWVYAAADAPQGTLILDPGGRAVAQIVFPRDAQTIQVEIVYGDASNGPTVVAQIGGGCAGMLPAIRIGFEP